MNLDSLMLAAPLPGLISFTLVGPGATNGPLTAQTLGSYSADPHQVEHLFDQYSSESGFAGWIKTWQDSAGSSQVVEIAIRFHQAGEATTNAAAFVSTLSSGLSGGTRGRVASIPRASAFTIDERATTSGSISIPAQQVQAVVFADGDYLIALHTDSPNGPGAHPIAGGTAIALALQQYQVLSERILPQAKAPTKAVATGGSTTQVVGLIMLAAVAIVIAAIAVVSWRRRQTGSRRVVRPGAARQVPAVAGTDSNRKAGPPRKRSWPESPALPDGTLVGASASGLDRTNERIGVDQNGDRNGVDKRKLIRNGVDRSGAQTGQASGPGSEKKRVSLGRLSRISNLPHLESGNDEQLVKAGAPYGRGSRSERLANSRTNHPSASVALAKSRPPAELAGWYTDPSDTQQRRIRYWDGGAWTSHVAEPEARARP